MRRAPPPTHVLPPRPPSNAAGLGGYGRFGRGIAIALRQGGGRVFSGRVEGTMAEPGSDAYQACWNAIQRRVCTVCLDVAADGSCGLGHARICALQENLAAIVETILSVRSDRMDEYVAAIEARICGGCRHQAGGVCGLRDKGECGLYTYLPLVVDAIEEVKGITLR